MGSKFMKRLFLAGLPLLLLLSACAPRRPAMAELPTRGEPQPDVGIVGWVESRRISLHLPGRIEPRVYARTPETRVFDEGIETSWAELRAGQAVRIQSVKGPFSPLLATTIDILSGEEEEAVRQEVLVQRGGQERSRSPCLRTCTFRWDVAVERLCTERSSWPRRVERPCGSLSKASRLPTCSPSERASRVTPSGWSSTWRSCAGVQGPRPSSPPA